MSSSDEQGNRAVTATTLLFAVSLVGLGFGGAFVAGLLGVGGAIVMIPLLLYGPPLLGVGSLDMRAVAGVTMMQVFVAAVSGVLAHRRRHVVNPELTWIGGVSMAAGSFSGALGSRFLDERWLILVFAIMATVAVVMMCVPVERLEPPGAAEGMHVNRQRTVAVGAGVGLVAGLVGAGGAFLLIPFLLVLVKVPVRVAIASSLGITALGATAGFFGKLLTGQVPLAVGLAVALGAIPGAQCGAAVSHQVTGSRLKQVLTGVISLTAVRVWWDFLSR